MKSINAFKEVENFREIIKRKTCLIVGQNAYLELERKIYECLNIHHVLIICREPITSSIIFSSSKAVILP